MLLLSRQARHSVSTLESPYGLLYWDIPSYGLLNWDYKPSYGLLYWDIPSYGLLASEIYLAMVYYTEIYLAMVY